MNTKNKIYLVVGLVFCVIIVGFWGFDKKTQQTMPKVEMPKMSEQKIPPTKDVNIETDIQDIYNKYSTHLDKQWTGDGWKYNVPSRHYKEINKNSSQNLRMQMTFASFYKYREDGSSKAKIKTVFDQVFKEVLPNQIFFVSRDDKIISTRSFHDAIGLFLALEIFGQNQHLFTELEKVQIKRQAEKMLPWILKAPDTENRALLGAAYGKKILENPVISFSEKEKQEYRDLINQKIQTGLKNIDSKNIYHEGGKNNFSLHYHVVSAAMLFVLGENEIARKMSQYVHDNYEIGKLSWEGSHRPTGIGLQTVLLRTFLEKNLNTIYWADFWAKEKNARGFIDPKNADRLVWYDDIDKTYNDDYSFANMVEIIGFGMSY